MALRVLSPQQRLNCPIANRGLPVSHARTTALQCPRARPGFFFNGGKTRRFKLHWHRRPRAGQSSWEGRGSNPLPTSRVWERCERPQTERSPDRSKVFHYFQHSCRMVCPDTIIRLIVDYNAAIGGRGWPWVNKKQDVLLLPITLPNADRFLKNFHRRTQQ